MSKTFALLVLVLILSPGCQSLEEKHPCDDSCTIFSILILATGIVGGCVLAVFVAIYALYKHRRESKKRLALPVPEQVRSSGLDRLFQREQQMEKAAAKHVKFVDAAKGGEEREYTESDGEDDDDVHKSLGVAKTTPK